MAGKYHYAQSAQSAKNAEQTNAKMELYFSLRSLRSLRSPLRVFYSIPHGPGPPQRPHMPGVGDEDLDDAAAELTAKTLIERVVFVERHSGHVTFELASSSLIDLTSRSKRASQLLQVYS
jgi:hypothetical protein